MLSKTNNMSYEILYDKQFIDLGDGQFVPMILAGSNNCTEFGYNNRERRARSWYSLTFLFGYQRPYGTCQEMINTFEDAFAKQSERLSDKDIKDLKRSFGSYGYYYRNGRPMSYGEHLGLTKTGCAKALTVEQLKEVGVSVSVSAYVYNSDQFKKDYPNIELKSFVPHTSAELKQVLDEYKEYYENTKVSIFITINADENKMKFVRKFYKNKNKVLTKLDSYWTIVAPNGNYFVKLIRRGFYSYKWSPIPYIVYSNESNAKRRVNSLNKRFKGEFKVEFVNEPVNTYI